MEFHNLPYIYLIKICIALSSCTSPVASNVNQYTILMISIIGGGLVSLFTTLSNYWYQERHKNKYDFLDDLIYVKEILEQKKRDPKSNVFSISKIRPFSKKRLIDKKLYKEIETTLQTQSDERTSIVNKVDEIIQNIDQLIEEI